MNAIQCYYDRAKEKCVWAKDNLLDNINDSLIDFRIACHPIRIFSDLNICIPLAI